MSRLLLATDLDRTLIPNGAAPESPAARERFARLVARPEVGLAYVTGRDLGRIDEAIAQWNLPVPDVVIADVGTTVAEGGPGRWRRWAVWDHRQIDDWQGGLPDDLHALLAEVPDLDLQDESRQGRFKLSFQTPPEPEGPDLAAEVRRRLQSAGMRINVIWSLDEEAGRGLLDVLPQTASKLKALEFLRAEWGYRPDEVLFAGDSGNDLDVLAGPFSAVLVANAAPAVREQAVRAAEAAGHRDRLYCARGGVLGLNGNYAAGILEGVLHFHPVWADRL